MRRTIYHFEVPTILQRTLTSDLILNFYAGWSPGGPYPAVPGAGSSVRVLPARAVQRVLREDAHPEGGNQVRPGRHRG